jgi:hypothetical protein
MREGGGIINDKKGSGISLINMKVWYLCYFYKVSQNWLDDLRRLK